jgi:aryl-alcohol dehydrogenase-like predicted oxidoreductase
MESALEAAGASLIPSAVLDGGALSGKYSEGGQGRLSGELGEPHRLRAIEIGRALREPAQRLQSTPATVATAFTLCHARSASTLIGATRPEQVDGAIDAVALAERLTADDLAELRALAQKLVRARAIPIGSHRRWTTIRQSPRWLPYMAQWVPEPG